MVEEVRDQFARLAKAENDRGREHLVVIASEELSRRGGGNARQRAKARRWAVENVRRLVAEAA
ncbi:hypothetical protein A3H75_02080 [Candidatus Uhrbacteria bacterium RIFCSPLOWO2_02_FULL_51_9]|uniref:Uncharacterized protein n=1 Tax=Candidatus Uhrbacteria bacterium RIFCSPLOWO2_02_FULL_51_9 TaxID=1802410 RepID=A0A1F7VEE0_9BACT|nr:MAG: hypothetical protein A3H75_02080 [Candidatus Uhrbacteria bacterium RIFCSPLOWO2_02_FULL_51_9]